MAKNISLMGASYSDVPAVTLPQTGGGTARFDDASVTTATAEDVAQGKVFLAADGTITTGTASGGGSVVVVDTPDGHGGTIREITATHVTTLVEKTITQNGTYDPGNDNADGYSSVTVNVGGSTPVGRSDVNFYDYDGTLLYAYTAAEAAELTEMPSNPSHTGLTAQGWNYTLAQMKTEVTAQGACDIGQMYVTDDGKTRLYCRFEEGRLHPYLGICVNGTVVVDWGDGSATSTLTGTTLTTAQVADHVYASGGDYMITLTVTSGSAQIIGNSSTTFLLRKANDTTSYIHQVYSNSLVKAQLGTDIGIGTYAFDSCYSLASITIPSGVTSIDHYAFQSCFALASITIPSGVTSIGIYALYDCHTLASITIPSGVTSISFRMFNNCYSLASITIPSGVTSIDTYVFNNCYSLASITIPSGVTSIGSNAFRNDYGLGEIHFKPTTPPTCANSNAWTNLQTDCVIYVPTGSLSAYTSATNYPSSSTYTYIEE